MKALIDSDSLIYKFAALNQEVTEWDENTTTFTTDLAKAKRGLKANIDDIMEATDTSDYLCVLSPKRTFRYDILPSYKGNRKPPKHPLELIKPLRKFMTETMKTHTPTYVEADDYCVWKMYEEPSKWVLCHIDKDLNQATGVHYNYRNLNTYKVTQEEADYVFYMQILQGDTSDGYKGCPGIGPKKAEKILQTLDLTNEQEVWDAIIETYEAKDLTEDDALVQARVARMLRPSEYDGDVNIKLWEIEKCEVST
jgi:DNA polymerase I